jgi:hypothetical protein
MELKNCTKLKFGALAQTASMAALAMVTFAAPAAQE